MGLVSNCISDQGLYRWVGFHHGLMPWTRHEDPVIMREKETGLDQEGYGPAMRPGP